MIVPEHQLVSDRSDCFCKKQIVQIIRSEQFLFFSEKVAIKQDKW